jgi:hypothetical protein
MAASVSRLTQSGGARGDSDTVSGNGISVFDSGIAQWAQRVSLWISLWISSASVREWDED